MNWYKEIKNTILSNNIIKIVMDYVVWIILLIVYLLRVRLVLLFNLFIKINFKLFFVYKNIKLIFFIFFY
jgi:hypothetical protein